MRYGFSLLFIALLIIVGSVILIGRGNNNSPAKSGTRLTVLADYENNSNAEVSWTIQGREVGDDQYREIKVTVSNSKRRVEVLSGYEQRVEKSAEFANNTKAFATFTRALDNLSFGLERNVKLADDRGVCPLGNRFIYRLTDGSKEIMRTWSDSCTKKDGPYGGISPNIVRELFKNQITDYNKFVSTVKL